METRKQRNWRARLVSLALGTTVWWIINGELEEKQSTVEDITLPAATVREL